MISSCHFSIFKRFEIKNYKADRRRNVYIDTKHMESALNGTVLMHSLLLYQESHLFAGLTCFISHITSTTCAYHMHKLPMEYSLFIINLPCRYMYLATEESSEADILKTISSKIL